jgi:hypothetical protein
MSPRIQELVSAQISVHRAVFEGNKAKPDELYIDDCIAQAQSDLAGAALKETKRRKLGAMARKKKSA